MQNYSRELLHQELSDGQQKLANASTRHEAVGRQFQSFVMPAVTGVAQAPRKPQQKPAAPVSQPAKEPTEAEMLARRQALHFGQVVPLEEAERVLDLADSITRMPCGCRFISAGKADRRYCLGLGFDRTGVLGKYPEASSSLEVLEKAEAKQLVRSFDRDGLVHSVWTQVTPYIESLCNCDRECLPYQSYIVKGGTPSFFRAEYVCQVDWDLCTGCNECEDLCQFDAKVHSPEAAKAYIDPRRCFGCGVCRSACQSNAIALVPREKVPEAADIWLRDADRVG